MSALHYHLHPHPHRITFNNTNPISSSNNNNNNITNNSNMVIMDTSRVHRVFKAKDTKAKDIKISNTVTMGIPMGQTGLADGITGASTGMETIMGKEDQEQGGSIGGIHKRTKS